MLTGYVRKDPNFNYDEASTLDSSKLPNNQIDIIDILLFNEATKNCALSDRNTYGF